MHFEQIVVFWIFLLVFSPLIWQQNREQNIPWVWLGVTHHITCYSCQEFIGLPYEQSFCHYSAQFPSHIISTTRVQFGKFQCQKIT